jgi:predicted ATPase/DNA-binding winged helix-turn-helix (wHTH) protein
VNNEPETFGEILTFGPYRLSPAERTLRHDQADVTLGGRAFEILLTLLENAGETVSQRELSERAWPGLYVEDANLRVHIANLRKVLGDRPGGGRYIENIPRRGYCFVAPVSRERLPLRSESPPAAQAPAESESPVQLPAASSRIVGRAATIDELAKLVLARRFVTIVGAGGIGKTTVAVSVAHAIKAGFTGGAFVDLGAVTDGTLVTATVARALGLTPHGDNVLAGLLTFLRNRRILLVVDNCEHLVDAVAEMAERLYSEAPGTYLLATSREALRVEGETVHLLAPLEVPPFDPDLSAAETLKWPAAQLFMERAFAAGHPGGLSDEEAPIVAAICRHLDGLALAIELAAARVASHGIRGTSDLLHHRFKLTWQGRRSALPRHQTMQSVLDWSHNLLSPEDRLVLARLSVLIGSFTLEAAQQIASDGDISATQVAMSLTSLAEKSLASTAMSAQGTSYRLLELTRSYALERLESGGELEAISRRHAQYCSDALADGRSESAFPDTTTLLSNLTAALSWSLSRAEDSIAGVVLAAQAVPVFRKRARMLECATWSERALATLDDSQRQTQIELVLLEEFAVSNMFARGNLNEVLIALARGLALCKAQGWRGEELRLLTWVHIFRVRKGDFADAAAVASRSAAIAEELGHGGALVASDWMQGVSSFYAGNQLRAQEYCESALSRSANATAAAYMEGLGFGQQVRGLTVYARALWLRGYPEQAATLAAQAIAKAERRQNQIALGIALVYTIDVTLWRGDLDLAAEQIERVITLATICSLEPFRIMATAMRGELAVLRGDVAAGIADLQAALGDLERTQQLVHSTNFLRALAEAYAKTGRHADARATLDRAFTQAETKGEIYLLPDILRARATLALALEPPDIAAAEDHLVAAIAEARNQSSPGWEMRAALLLAQLQIEQGRREDAEQVLRPALAAYSEGFDLRDLIAARALLG